MKRLEDLIEKHGHLGFMFEQNLYGIAEHFSSDYDGGYWTSEQVNQNDNGFYLELSGNESYKIQNCQNGYDSGDMDDITFGLAIFTFACNIVGTQAYEHGDMNFANDLFELQHYCQNNALQILGDETRHSKFHWFLD